MITWKCLEHGVIPADQVGLLTWDSPHGEEYHEGCGTAVDWEAPDEPALTASPVRP